MRTAGSPHARGSVADEQNRCISHKHRSTQIDGETYGRLLASDPVEDGNLSEKLESARHANCERTTENLHARVMGLALYALRYLKLDR